jgi:hypothetical protein
LPNTFPGWASSAATMFTYLFRLSDSTVPLITTIFLIAIALHVTLSPVVYNTLEKVELVLGRHHRRLPAGSHSHRHRRVGLDSHHHQGPTGCGESAP